MISRRGPEVSEGWVSLLVVAVIKRAVHKKPPCDLGLVTSKLPQSPIVYAENTILCANTQ